MNDAADFDRASGADVVVLTGGADVPAVATVTARRAPGAVLVLATDDPEGDCHRALEASLLPRGRVVAVAREDVREAVAAIVLDRGAPLTAVMRLCGERGVDGVAAAPVLLGAGGVRRIDR